jgi:membrane protease subunit (stomatin/prohibitin family)
MKEIVGTDGLFQVDEISGQLRNMLVAEFTDALAALKVPALDLAGNYGPLSEKIRERVAARFGQYGLGIPSFVIENISLPEDVEKALDKRTSMGIVGDMGRYTQYQAATAIEKAAEQGGTGASGLELGAGLAMGQQMAQAIGSAGAASAPAQPSAPATAACPSCGHANAPTAKFCSECGARMTGTSACEKCGEEVPARAKFCPACGEARTPGD